MELVRQAMDIPAVLGSVVLALTVAQGMKLLLIALRHHQRLRLEDIVVTGGMPSAHSATVTALCLSILSTEGWQNSTFVLALVLAVIVIRDSLGVRRTAGKEGKTINSIIRLAHVKTPPVHYSLGHTPIEVAVGTRNSKTISMQRLPEEILDPPRREHSLCKTGGSVVVGQRGWDAGLQIDGSSV